MPGEEELASCQECGATIYPEHLERRLAEHWEGRLLCVHCLRTKRAGASTAPAVGPAPVAPPPPAGPAEGAVPIALIDEEETTASIADALGVNLDRKPTAIKSFGGGPGGMQQGLDVTESKLRRSVQKGSPNATRCRVFHCKLADAAMVYMCEQINEWADSSDDIEIKFATSVIGVVEGKHADPHLIVTVFY